MTPHCVPKTLAADSIHMTCFALSLVFCESTQAQLVVPGGFFFDDFEDGNLKDNKPVNWGRGAWNGATEGIINGDLEINNTRNFGSSSGGISILAPRNPSDTSYLGSTNAIYRTQARITKLGEEGTQIGFLARSTAPSGYFARIDSDGEVALFDFPQGEPGIDFGRVQTDLDLVNNDVVMRFRTVGDSLVFSVWEDGDSIPAQPLIVAHNDSFSFGTIGVYALSTNNTPASAKFRWASVAEIPVPTAGRGFSVLRPTKATMRSWE